MARKKLKQTHTYAFTYFSIVHVLSRHTDLQQILAPIAALRPLQRTTAICGGTRLALSTKICRKSVFNWLF